MTEDAKITASPDAEQPGKLFIGLLLAAWIAFLAGSVLWDVREPGPRKPIGSYDAAAYARILQTPERIFPGYPYTALDAVRDLLNPIFHLGRRAFLGSTVFFLAVLCLGTFFAAGIAVGRSAGFLAALLVASSPFAVTTARTYDVHVPKLAMIALMLAALLWLHKLPSWKSALGAVAALAAATLVCNTSSEYVFFGVATSGMFIAVVLHGLIKSGHRRLFAATVLVLLAFVALPAYAILVAPPFPGKMRGFVRLMGIMPIVPDPSKTLWRDPAVLWTYPTVLIITTLGYYLAAIMAAGLVLFALRRDAPKYVLLTGLLVPFFIITAMPKRNIYYIATLLPLLSICAAAGIDRVLARLGRAGLIAVFIAAVAWNLALSTGRIASGKVPAKLRPYFVPGKTVYKPGYDELSFEPLGTTAKNEDAMARDLADILIRIPRPAALGFFAKPCIQKRLALELAWRGIFARDVLCTSFEQGLPAYDAVVVTPRLLLINGVSDAPSLTQIYEIILRAVESDDPDAGRLYPEVAGRVLVPPDLVRNNRQLFPVLVSAREEIARLSGIYKLRVRKGDYIFFLPPENRELGQNIEQSFFQGMFRQNFSYPSSPAPVLNLSP